MSLRADWQKTGLVNTKTIIIKVPKIKPREENQMERKKKCKKYL